jgi:hypothetical protein
MPEEAQGSDGDGAGRGEGEGEGGPAPRRVSRIWLAMSGLLGINDVLGVVAILSLTYGRPTGWFPMKGRGVYLAHGVAGILLGLGAVYLFARYWAAGERTARLAARLGIIGVAIGGAGGFLTVSHPLRLAGMGLMLLGSIVAGVGYLLPAIEEHDRKERAAMQGRYFDGPPPVG